LTGTHVPSYVLESLVAHASVRAGGVLAATVGAADAVTVNAALVDVDAVVAGPGRVAGRADAVIPTLPVLAGLTLAALVDALAALVHVDAVLPRHGVQGVAGPADYSGRRAPATFVEKKCSRCPRRVQLASYVVYSRFSFFHQCCAYL